MSIQPASQSDKSATPMSALRRGQRFQMNGVRWRVAYVNASRAHCVATVREPVTVSNRRTGNSRTFTATRRIALDISPQSGVDVLAELERGRKERERAR